VEGGHEVVCKGNYLPQRKITLNRLQTPKPHDDYDTDIYQHGQNRAHRCHNPHNLDIFLSQVVVSCLETFCLIFSAYKGLYKSSASYVFLQHGIEAIESLLDSPKEGLHLCAEKEDHHCSNYENWHHRKSQCLAGHEHESNTPDHRERGFRAKAKRHLEQTLDSGRIARKAYHESSS